MRYFKKPSRKTHRNFLLPYGVIGAVAAVMLWSEAGNNAVTIWLRIVGGIWAGIGIFLILLEGGGDD